MTVLMRGLPTSSAQWLWSQFTLAHHAFVSLSNAPYLILKFAVAHRQSFDDDIRALPHIQACRKQTRTNLEFMHDAHRPVSLYARNWGQVYAKGTATSRARALPNIVSIIVIAAITTATIAIQFAHRTSLRLTSASHLLRARCLLSLLALRNIT